jgi:hypothetical protein
MVLALNTVSGQIADVSPKTLQHPHFSKFLVPVEDGAKPYAPELYKSGTAEEKEKDNKKFSRKKKAAEEESVVVEEETTVFFFNDEVTEEETQTEEDK